MFHFANGFERGNEIVVDYVRHESLGHGGRSRTPPRLHRLVLDPAAGKLTDAFLFDGPVEFPRIDDRRGARASRHIYVPTLTGSLKLASPATATFNCLLKVDTESGRTGRHDFGNRIATRRRERWSWSTLWRRRPRFIAALRRQSHRA